MKNLITSLLILLLPLYAWPQQNLIFNGSFEQYIQCSNNSIGNGLVGWREFISTADYFSTCNNSMPTSNRGYQYPAHGQAYIGILDFSSPSNYGYRESVTAYMQPMEKGKPYEVSMSVCVADKSYYFTNSLCVYFFDTGKLFYQSFTDTVPFIPQISFANYGQITDTQNWVRLRAVFTPDSAYDHIAIGGFLKANTVSYTATNFPNPIGTYNYVFIDSVVVKLYDSMTFVFNDSSLCVKDTLSIPYFALIGKQPNNVFTLQLSNASGSFASPINIGTKTSDSSGYITGIIPANIANGTGYRIRLLSSNPADTSKDNGFNISIGNPDSAAILVSSNSPSCKGTRIDFSAVTGISSSTYLWSGPNSFTSTSATPFINNADAIHNGDYYATIKFYGCEVKDTTPVVVKPLPTKPTAGINTPLCVGNSINLTSSNTTNGVTYTWAGPNSFTSSILNPVINNISTGMSGYYILTADLNGCKVSDTITAAVHEYPDTVTLTTNAPICEGDSLKIFSDSSTIGATYTWNGPNSFLSYGKDTVIANTTTSATGWYKMAVNLSGCIYRDSVYAAVYIVPSTPTVSYINPMCVGETLNLLTNGLAGATYSWAGPNNFFSGQQNPTRANMQFGDTGLYSLTTTLNGCTSPISAVRVNVNPLPFVVIFPTPGDTICLGDNVTFTALPNNYGGVPQYQWYVNGAPVSGSGITFSSTLLANGDVVRCNMTENTKCNTAYTDESNDIEMKVLPWLAPSVTFTVSPNRPLELDEYVTFTAMPVNAGASPTYQWKRNGQNIQGATGVVWSANTLNDNDSISVEITSSYKCPQPLKAFANGVRVKILSGISDIANNNSIKVYPNPVKGTLRITSTISIETITINNLLGQQLMQQTANGNTADIDMSALAAGVYVVKVNGVYAVRVTKE